MMGQLLAWSKLLDLYMEGDGDDAGVVAVELAGLGSVGVGGWEVDAVLELRA